MCKHPQPCNASHRQPVSGVSPPKPSAAHTEGFVDKSPQLLSMNLGGRWTSRHVHRWEMAAATCNSYLQCRIEQPRGQYCWVSSNSDFKQCLLAYLLLQIEDTCGTSITQWIAIHVHTVWELHMTWKSRDQQFLWHSKRRKAPPTHTTSTHPTPRQGLFGAPFVVPTYSPLCAHRCSRWKMLLRAPAGPPLTTAECFNKCQSWHERSLSKKTDQPSHFRQVAAISWQSSWLFRVHCFYNQALPLLAMSWYF